ncbi:hypothetical protein JVU11DRAFT_2216 [Chiua virens]|nr:hypothetical protein JVU11DRAFT_2216 [Chiua virens]
MAPALVAGSGPSGVVSALTLLQDHIPVRILDKQPHYNIGQRGSGIWPRTFDVFHFLRAHELYQRAMLTLAMREYKPGTPSYITPVVYDDFCFPLAGVTRKQPGLSFLGETRQEFASVVGDICIEIEGLNRNVRHGIRNCSDEPRVLELNPARAHFWRETRLVSVDVRERI